MYKFSLGSVLNHRINLEEYHQKELSILQASLMDEQKKYEDLESKREKYLRELDSKQIESITASESMLYTMFLAKLSSQLDIQKKKIIEKEKQVELKREELIVAMKNRKALENLKEKGLEKYNRLVMKKEQEFMNEMASVRFKSK